MASNSVVVGAFAAGAAVASAAALLLRGSAVKTASSKPKESGRFSSINKDTSGARTQKDLPVGKHPIQLYSLATPNGQKVTIMLEEIGLKYDAYMINIMKGDQFTSGFVEINPNSKIPAMVDQDGPGGKPLRVFESGNILLYLAEKTGKLLPADGAERVECLNWLFFQMGAGPYLGQFGHFYKYAPEKIQYGVDRYATETRRIVDVLEKRLAVTGAFLAGDEYTIADIAWAPWIRCLETGYSAKEYLRLNEFPNVNTWLARCSERPAFKKGLVINSSTGIKEYHSE
eukprot:m.76708 g.76708  ORF g.76708 m.76708 type:complete len:286 (-) comp14520_c0_seq4:27-884(-)